MSHDMAPLIGLAFSTAERSDQKRAVLFADEDQGPNPALLDLDVSQLMSLCNSRLSHVAGLTQ